MQIWSIHYPCITKILLPYKYSNMKTFLLSCKLIDIKWSESKIHAMFPCFKYQRPKISHISTNYNIAPKSSTDQVKHENRKVFSVFQNKAHIVPAFLLNESLFSFSYKGPFVNYVSILGYLVGKKRAIFAYF